MSAAWEKDISWRVTPMTMPPKTLIAKMMRPAMASPRTNLEAPSMEPKNELSSSSSRRRRIDSFSSMSPAERSASIAICLPGMASRGKACADLGDARRTLGDHEEVHRDQDDEHDRTDHEVAAHHKVGEARDNVPGCRVALVAVRQNKTRRGDVERQTQYRRDQQDGRKGGEVERTLYPQRHHQNENGQRDGEGETDVDERRRQGQEQHRQNKDNADCQAHVLVAGTFHRRCSGHERFGHELPTKSSGIALAGEACVKVPDRQ